MTCQVTDGSTIIDPCMKYVPDVIDPGGSDRLMLHITEPCIMRPRIARPTPTVIKGLYA